MMRHQFVVLRNLTTQFSSQLVILVVGINEVVHTRLFILVDLLEVDEYLFYVAGPYYLTPASMRGKDFTRSLDVELIRLPVSGFNNVCVSTRG